MLPKTIIANCIGDVLSLLGMYFLTVESVSSWTSESDTLNMTLERITR